jgi:hypothetical protein
VFFDEDVVADIEKEMEEFKAEDPDTDAEEDLDMLIVKHLETLTGYLVRSYEREE